VEPNLALREVGEAFSTLYRCDRDPGTSVELKDATGKKKQAGSDLDNEVF
jgi:hypothetical protein